ncbi:MAG: hypothetical protein PHY64_11435 [Eubacteriales bacterium]|nr:hypothetical protein [Eubacteriales bacterium]
MIRKVLTTVLCLFVLVSAGAAFAEESAPLEGLITKTGDGYFIMNDVTQGEMQVNLDASITMYEGSAAKDSLAVGQYVYVQYNGVITRTSPPQVTADKVSCFQVTGTVTAILDTGFTVENDPILGTVIVHMGEGLPPVYKGVPITLYYNGVMALSYPPQLTAVYLAVPTLEGLVSGLSEDGFTLTLDDGTSYRVALTMDTDILALPADGEQLLVYYIGETGAAVTALAVASPDGEGTEM